MKIIAKLQRAADIKAVFFGLKLTNSLESNNFRQVFGNDQQQMSMSGKSLHPLAVSLAATIREDFPNIDISFSAGPDCFNVPILLACNLSPVTVSSDLLKPGGYGRLQQYTKILKEKLVRKHLSQVRQLIDENLRKQLQQYSRQVIEQIRLKKPLREPTIKTLKPLGYFDCIHASCMCTCPGNQNILEYMYQLAQGHWQKVFEVIMQTNPFPSVTGAVCDHECQTRCTRINYDDPLAIREVKRYVASFEHDEHFVKSLPYNGFSVKGAVEKTIVGGKVLYSLSGI